MFVLFATPCLSAKVELDYFNSFYHTSAMLAVKGISHVIKFQPGIPFIDHARNILCHDFLHEFPDATDLFFIDDDVGWHSESVMRLLQCREDVVGGCYPLKQDPIGFPISLESKAGSGKLIKRRGLYEASFLPTGFMRIKRSVIERMGEVVESYPYRRSDGTTIDMIKNIFQTGVKDGERWGEDVDFANRWRAMGGRLWVDPEIVLTHVGRKKWTASFADAVAIAQHKLAEMEPAK